MARAVAGKRVVPEMPPGRTAILPPEDDDDAERGQADSEPSTLALFLVYENAKRERSERRVTVRQVVGDPPTTLVCFCHERHAARSFRVDRIVEVYDAHSGEVLDALGLRDLLVAARLPRIDPVLRRAVNVLVFLARCDGRMVAGERDAIDDALASWCLRFGGDDGACEQAVRLARRVAPDADDFLIGLRSMAKDPRAPQLARWLRGAASEVIDADGSHHAKEIEWAGELNGFLRVMEGAR